MRGAFLLGESRNPRQKKEKKEKREKLSLTGREKGGRVLRKDRRGNSWGDIG